MFLQICVGSHLKTFWAAHSSWAAGQTHSVENVQEVLETRFGSGIYHFYFIPSAESHHLVPVVNVIEQSIKDEVGTDTDEQQQTLPNT